MTTRTLSITLLAGLSCIALCMLLYRYLHAGSGAISGAAPVAADTAVIADSVPTEFARLFEHGYSFDTVNAASDRFMIDTMLPAVRREGVMGGRNVSISICGVDSRLNERVEHADANHVVTVWLDSGIVEITSIPRDTPCDAGIAGSRGHNNLANLRARKGRDAYLREVAAISGLDTIEYYVELGFSQARGLLELLGFGGDAGAALRVLRSRQAFSAGDFQRSFNQGEFIRQTLLGNFGRLDGIAGDLIIRAGLYMVTTNLTADRVAEIVGMLRAKGFPGGSRSVTVAIRPEYYARMAVFNFSDSVVLGNLLNRINRKAEQLGIGSGDGDSAMHAFGARVRALLASAAADSARLPVRVIANLRRCFEQRVWWQIADRTERAAIRREMGELLAHAYDRAGRAADAARVREIVGFEERMLAADAAAR